MQNFAKTFFRIVISGDKQKQKNDNFFNFGNLFPVGMAIVQLPKAKC